mmetsp:Transcript_69778/g.220240  ORF Transcript_69778/g.220240 Transcript_69778/m.220240 type:complete len:478 (-) Transcript_69778:102-1535(-)
MSTAEAIMVGMRLRPLVGKIEQGQVQCIRVKDLQTVSIIDGTAGEEAKEFHVDVAMDSTDPQSPNFVSQEKCYLLMGKRMLDHMLQGYNTCLFCYGQTGTGKTYTLSGSAASGEKGIQDMAIREILRLAEASASEGGTAYEVRLSALEIYNEAIHDLLAGAPAHSALGSQSPGRASSASALESARLEVRLSRDSLLPSEGDSLSGIGASSSAPSQFGSMRVPGLRTWRIAGVQDVEPALRLVAANRHVAATALNERSSRSHCVLSLSLAPRAAGGEEAPNGVGVLHIVDLAGSERTKVSQAEGQQLKEANCINRSLSSLADVLYALGDSGGASHVPYRNSKLTYLLQDALGGPGCKTFLFAQISPEPADVHESYSTLTFASRVATSVQKGRLRLMPSASASQRCVSPAGRRSTTPRGSPALGQAPPLPLGHSGSTTPPRDFSSPRLRNASSEPIMESNQASIWLSPPGPLARGGSRR